jgi:AbrB family looped-hinge helix DNA binding protein
MSVKSQIGDIGRLYIPKEMRKKLNIKEGDILELTATENLIVIEKCESDTE